jgi:hypothetical protein
MELSVVGVRFSVSQSSVVAGQRSAVSFQLSAVSQRIVLSSSVELLIVGFGLARLLITEKTVTEN